MDINNEVNKYLIDNVLNLIANNNGNCYDNNADNTDNKGDIKTDDKLRVLMMVIINSGNNGEVKMVITMMTVTFITLMMIMIMIMI